MRRLNWMLAAAAAAGVTTAVHAQAEAREEALAFVMLDAQRDFDAVRVESALSGSAPLAGLQDESKAKAYKKSKSKSKKAGKAERVDSAASARPAKHSTALDLKPAPGQP